MRMKAKIQNIRSGNLNYVVAQPDIEVDEYYVSELDVERNEAIIEVPEQALIKKLLREVEDIKRRVEALERGVMRSAGT